MRIEGIFDCERLNSKEKAYFDIAQLSDGSTVRLPLLIVHGRRPGKTILVLGGVHGDEHEGPQGVREVFDYLKPQHLVGKFVGVPIANPSAHDLNERTSPIDNLDLARTFPGQSDGTITRRIAFQITKIIRKSDFLLDLHSSGADLDAPTLCGYIATDGEVGQITKKAAEIFGAPVVWEHPPGAPPGRTLSVAAEEDIPALYTESSGGGWLTKETVACYKAGVLNVMKYLEMLPGIKTKPNKVKHHIFGGGDLDRDSAVASTSGFLLGFAETLDSVKKGEMLGKIIDSFGDTLQEVKALSDGYVVFRRANPIVKSGDSLYLLAHDKNRT